MKGKNLWILVCSLGAAGIVLVLWIIPSTWRLSRSDFSEAIQASDSETAAKAAVAKSNVPAAVRLGSMGSVGPLMVLSQRAIMKATEGERPRVRQFKWIEWNLQKIDAHGLSAEEIEAAFDRVFRLEDRKDGSFQMFAATPSGRRIWVIWRYDREDDEIPDVFGELGDVPIFVITAY